MYLGGIVLPSPTVEPREPRESLHCRIPGDMMSSSMSSMSSDIMKCWGVARPPMRLGSRFRVEAREESPGLLTMVNPVKISICCQRCSLSLSAAVTSPRACLDRGEERETGMTEGYKHRSQCEHRYMTYWLRQIPIQL